MGGSKIFHHLPEEIIEEILCHLPSKSLLRFKCVSKRWRSLISSKQFIKHHLKKSSANLSRHKLILILNTTSLSHLINHGFRSCSLRSLIENRKVRGFDGPPLVDHIHNNCILGRKYYNPAADPFNIYGGHEDIGIYNPSDSFMLEILGSCNGLILIRINRRNLFIWNPTTRQAKSIAQPACHAFRIDYSDIRHGEFVYGFGYDESADEYKIVCIFFTHRKMKPRGTTEIYSSRTDSWKKIEDFDMVSFRRLTFFSYGRFTGKFVKGKMHWLADPKDGVCWEIVSFDLSEEKYGIVGRPECFSNRTYYFQQPRLHELGGYLSFTGFNGNAVLGGMDVWVMTKYGATESWVKFYTISDEMMSVHGRGMFSYALMLTTIENGDVVLSFVESRGLNVVVYNGSNMLHKSRVDGVFANDYDGAFFDANIYVESLVSPFLAMSDEQ